MIRQTDKMREILKSEVAQRIIDFVSPIYGDSYVALWIYQVIGSALDQLCETADNLRTETNPATADLLMDYWETHYGLPKNTGLTIEQRQSRVISGVMAKGPCSPKALADAVSASLLGHPVDVEENVGKNTFAVNIHEYSGDISEAKKIVARMKPAHLLCRVQTVYTAEAETEIASAATFSEKYGIKMVCELYEDVDIADLIPSSAVTLHEQHYVEVL